MDSDRRKGSILERCLGKLLKKFLMMTVRREACGWLEGDGQEERALQTPKLLYGLWALFQCPKHGLF